MDPLIEKKQERHALLKKNRNIVDKAGKEDRGLKEAEEKEFNKREKKIDKLETEIRELEEKEEREKEKNKQKMVMQSKRKNRRKK